MGWKDSKLQLSDSESKTPDVNSQIPKNSSPNDSSGKNRTNNDNSISVNKNVSSIKKKKKISKKVSKKVFKKNYLNVEDILQDLWKHKTEFGFTQLIILGLLFVQVREVLVLKQVYIK